MKNKKGFSLIELLTVVTIIGILTVVALPKYKKSLEKAYLAQVLPTVRGLSTAIKACRTDIGSEDKSLCLLDSLSFRFEDRNGNLLTNSNTSSNNQNPTYLTEKWAIHRNVSGTNVNYYTIFRAPYAGTYFCGFDVSATTGSCTAWANVTHPKGMELMHTFGYDMTSSAAIANGSGDWRKLPC